MTDVYLFPGAVNPSDVQLRDPSSPAAPQVYTYAGAGGILLSGLATLARSKDWIASGGVVFAGAAALSTSQDWIASGGLELAGQAAIAVAKTFTPSGGITFAGAATIAEAKDWSASGGLELGGQASCEYFAGGAPAPEFVPIGAPRRLRRTLELEQPVELPRAAQVFEVAAAGGVGFGGSAETLWAPVPLQTFEVLARAGIGNLAGAAGVARDNPRRRKWRADEESLLELDIV